MFVDILGINAGSTKSIYASSKHNIVFSGRFWTRVSISFGLLIAKGDNVVTTDGA